MPWCLPRSRSLKCLDFHFCKHINLCDDQHLSLYLGQCVSKCIILDLCYRVSQFVGKRLFLLYDQRLRFYLCQSFSKEVWAFSSVTFLGNRSTSVSVAHVGHSVAKICNSTSFCFSLCVSANALASTFASVWLSVSTFSSACLSLFLPVRRPSCSSHNERHHC